VCTLHHAAARCCAVVGLQERAALIPNVGAARGCTSSSLSLRWLSLSHRRR
jgi:hypothetical protein